MNSVSIPHDSKHPVKWNSVSQLLATYQRFTVDSGLGGSEDHCIMPVSHQHKACGQFPKMDSFVGPLK